MGSPPRPPRGTRDSGLQPAEEPTQALAHRSDYRLVRSLLLLQNEGAVGTIRVDAEGVLTVIRIREGRPVFVEGGLPSDSVGRLLVARGQITEAQLAQIEETRMLMQGRLRFGEVAQRMGILESAALEAALRDQICEKLARCLCWDRSQHTFDVGEHASPILAGAPLEVEPLIFRGIARHYARERAHDVLAPAWHAAVELENDPQWIGDRFGLSKAERALLGRITRSRSIGLLLAERGSETIAIEHLLVALALTDQLAMPDPAVPEESGPFVIDELMREPRRSRRPVGIDEMPEESITHIGLMRKSQVPITDRHLPGKDKLLADSAYLQGRELLRAGEYGAAADAFREASNLRPGALEYALFAAWSAYLSTGRDPKWREMLVELCAKTMGQDPLLAFAHHVKGQLALEIDDKPAAREAFARALELDPQDEDARAALEGL